MYKKSFVMAILLSSSLVYAMEKEKAAQTSAALSTANPTLLTQILGREARELMQIPEIRDLINTLLVTYQNTEVLLRGALETCANKEIRGRSLEQIRTELALLSAETMSISQALGESEDLRELRDLHMASVIGQFALTAIDKKMALVDQIIKSELALEAVMSDWVQLSKALPGVAKLLMEEEIELRAKEEKENSEKKEPSLSESQSVANEGETSLPKLSKITVFQRFIIAEVMARQIETYLAEKSPEEKLTWR